jgi:hypothetical protein
MWSQRDKGTKRGSIRIIRTGSERVHSHNLDHSDLILDRDHSHNLDHSDMWSQRNKGRKRGSIRIIRTGGSVRTGFNADKVQ